MTPNEYDHVINNAVNAVASLFSSPGRTWHSYLDSDSSSLEACANNIASGKFNSVNECILLIKTGKTESTYYPWTYLLESVLQDSHIGVLSLLEDVAVNILSFSKPLHAELRQINYGSSFRIVPHEELNTEDACEQVKNRLLAWAKMESLLSPSYNPIFSNIVGGVKPVVFVFDDYNNFIEPPSTKGVIEPKSIPEDFVKLYMNELGEKASNGNDSKEMFKEILYGYCLNLNNLSLFCKIIAPTLWIEGKGQPDYELVASALPFSLIDALRSTTAAFIVDLEWKPTMGNPNEVMGDHWADMGYRAIYLLSKRYPEIPCFVYTGDWEIKKLQEGLSYGASWCFKKEKTHHYIPLEKTQNGLSKAELLTFIEFEHQLRNATLIRYNSYKEVPHPNQLKLDPDLIQLRKLLDKLSIRLPLGQCDRGKTLQKLFAGLFPEATEIRPIKIISSGKSDAQATLLVSPVSSKGEQQATRFIKIGPWLNIQKEYHSYINIIQPRLNSYVANVVGMPAKAGGDHGDVPWGAISYSMAGFPEEYSILRSLNDILNDQIDKPGGDEFITERIVTTLERVLLPLHGNNPKGRRRGKPLWNWLGDALPPVYTGVLVPLTSLDSLGENRKVLSSYLLQGINNNEAWLLASRDLKQIIFKENLSPWKEKFYQEEMNTLSDFTLAEIEWEGGELKSGRITLTHPDLGIRIRLRGKADDIRRRFRADWIRLGFPVEVAVCLDEENVEEDRFRERIKSAIKSLGLFYEKPEEILNKINQEDSNGTHHKDLNPFDFFLKEAIPYHWTIDAREGPIHGDLNLENILFSGDEKVGWLIDFAIAKEDGMIAFDFAKLELEIWNYHLSPLLGRFATGFGKDKYLDLLLWALKALDYGEMGWMLFETGIKSNFNISEFPPALLPVKNLIRIISAIRNFGHKQAHLSEEELKWALAAYAFTSLKFKNLNDWSVISSFIMSAWYLSKVAPDMKAK